MQSLVILAQASYAQGVLCARGVQWFSGSFSDSRSFALPHKSQMCQNLWTEAEVLDFVEDGMESLLGHGQRDLTLPLFSLTGELLETYVVQNQSSGRDLYDIVLRDYPAPGNAVIDILCSDHKVQARGTLAEQGMEDGSKLTYVRRLVHPSEYSFIQGISSKHLDDLK